MKIVTPVLIVLALLLCWRCDNLRGRLDMEESRHESTRKDLRAALEENARWSTSYDAAVDDVKAQKGNAEACLDREARAEAAARERADIMDKAVPQARKPTDKVIDHETRARVVDRLNRPL